MGLFNPKKTNKNLNCGNRMLITITIAGSPGPMRFIVNEQDSVVAVINTVLKDYDKQRRLPILGNSLMDFVLCYGHEALSPWEKIGAKGGRNFMLCMKPEAMKRRDNATGLDAITPKKRSGWRKTWLSRLSKLRFSSQRVNQEFFVNPIG